MRRALVVTMLLVGCGAPFSQVKPSSPMQGVALVYCGSAAVSPESIMKSMEPPTGQVSEGTSSMPEEKELRVCLHLENHGSAAARLERGEVRLKCPAEVDTPSADTDDQLVIAHPGETRELHVSFRYSPLVHGEDVQLLLDRAVTVGGHALKLPPIVLRKQ